MTVRSETVPVIAARVSGGGEHPYLGTRHPNTGRISNPPRRAQGARPARAAVAGGGLREPTPYLGAFDMGPQDPHDVARDVARDLSGMAGELAQLKADANHWLTGPEYEVLRHRLEDSHAANEAALVEARRRVRLSEEQDR